MCYAAFATTYVYIYIYIHKYLDMFDNYNSRSEKFVNFFIFLRITYKCTY